ncbi:MAG: type II secretion system F family protein [Methanobacteriota archaeon]
MAFRQKTGSLTPGGNILKRVVYKIIQLFKWVLTIVLWGVNTIILIILRSMSTITKLLTIFVRYLPQVTAGFVSHNRRSRLNNVLVYGGINMDADEVISLTLVYSILFSIIAGLVSLMVKTGQIQTLGVILFMFMMVWGILFMVLDLLMYRRTESIENVLPDVLDMIAQNMITGMTAYNSLLFAAHPEFGPLAHEIELAAKSTLTGTPLEEALSSITERVDSDKLERSINLIIQGMRSGGELPSVLQGVSRDMRAERNLKKQMAAETSGYAMFILFTILIGAPLLFAISLQFITVFSSLFEQTGLSDLADSGTDIGPGGSFMQISNLAVTSNFFLRYAIANLAVIAFFGSFIMGLIKTGKPISGIQNIPILVIVTICLFFTFNYILRNVFSNLIGF